MISRRGLVAAAAVGLAAPKVARAAAPLKVAFVYVGPVGDFGWTYQHDVARRQVQARFGAAIETSFVENVPEAPESLFVFERLAAAGTDLIFSTSFGFQNYVLKAAAEHPRTAFEQCEGFKLAPNVASFDIRYYQGRYVQGVIAGRMSKAGVAGFVAPVPLPSCVQCLDAFLLGMRKVNPAAKLKFVMINSWYDPGKEGEAATALIDQGCDIITQYTDSPAALQVAAARGIDAFGEATDMIAFAPRHQLTASVNNWTPYYAARIQARLVGAWKSGATWGGFDTGMMQMAPFRNMPAPVAALARQTVAELSAGRERVFMGPLRDQTGAVFLPAGQVMDDTTLSGLRTLVAGIEGGLA